MQALPVHHVEFHASFKSVPDSADQEKKARERVTSTPERWTNARALGFSTFTVTRSLPKSTVTMRATKVAKASTVWNDVSSTFYKKISTYSLVKSSSSKSLTSATALVMA